MYLVLFSYRGFFSGRLGSLTLFRPSYGPPLSSKPTPSPLQPHHHLLLPPSEHRRGQQYQIGTCGTMPSHVKLDCVFTQYHRARNGVIECETVQWQIESLVTEWAGGDRRRAFRVPTQALQNGQRTLAQVRGRNANKKREEHQDITIRSAKQIKKTRCVQLCPCKALRQWKSIAECPRKRRPS